MPERPCQNIFRKETGLVEIVVFSTNLIEENDLTTIYTIDNRDFNEQAILMNVRRHKEFNLLIEFSKSIFIKFCLKAFLEFQTSWHQTYKILF